MADAGIEPEEFLTVAKAAELLHLSPRSVTQKLRKGEIEGFKTGRPWLVYRSGIETYLKSVQPTGVKPPSLEGLRSSAYEAARALHISTLLENLRTFRIHLANLDQPSEFERWLRGPNAEMKLPEFNRVTWRSIQQHLANIDAQVAWQAWQGSVTILLERERLVFELIKELGEAEFEMPLLPRDPAEGGRLTEGFPAAGLALVRTYDDPSEVARDTRVTIEGGELRYNSSYALSMRTELTEPDGLNTFLRVVEKAVASKQASTMRSGLNRYREATRKFEDELDGIDLAQSIPGNCNWCPKL